MFTRLQHSIAAHHVQQVNSKKEGGLGTRSGDTSECRKHDALTLCMLSLHLPGGRGGVDCQPFTVTKAFYQLHKAVKLCPCPPKGGVVKWKNTKLPAGRLAGTVISGALAQQFGVFVKS